MSPILASIPASLRTAIDFKKALDNAAHNEGNEDEEEQDSSAGEVENNEDNENNEANKDNKDNKDEEDDDSEEDSDSYPAEHLDTPEVPADATLRRKIKDVLTKLPILLQHHYSAGTAELNGFDATLYAAAGETPGGDVKLPLVGECTAHVFPMTEMHVSAILAHIRKEEDDTSGSSKSTEELFVDLKGTDAQ
ncbi:hypothetical protein C8R44DRAFT_884737 [Mycena epipterygia]|nr:hypothetical protein C8R44DRAFT_884737 [Mycena epipterygia]